MRERTEYPAGVPCWLDTSQPDPEAAAAFYGGLFGWEFEDRTPPACRGATSWPSSVAATSPRSAHRRPGRPGSGLEHLRRG